MKIAPIVRGPVPTPPRVCPPKTPSAIDGPVDFQPLTSLPDISVAEVQPEQIDNPSLAAEMLAQLRQWPSLKTVISVAPEDRDGQSEILVASRADAVGQSRHQGIFEVVQRLASSDGIKAEMRRFPSKFQPVKTLDQQAALHEVRLPGVHSRKSLEMALLEGGQSNRHDQLQQLLADLPQGRRVALLVAGPPGSGKSGVIAEVQEQAARLGRNVTVLEGDMYFKKDRTGLPLTEQGTPYWDHPAYMDMSRLRQDIGRLIVEGEAETPIYQFSGADLATSQAQPTRRLSLGQDDILLIDSLHAASPDIVSHLRDQNLEHATVYLDSPTAEMRMVRRMVRDYEHRGGWLPEQTMAFWDATTWKGEVEFVRPTMLQMDPGQDLFLQTRFPKDVDLSREQIDQRIELLNAHGLPPTYEAFAAQPQELPDLAKRLRQELEGRLSGLTEIEGKTLERLKAALS